MIGGVLALGGLEIHEDRPARQADERLEIDVEAEVDKGSRDAVGGVEAAFQILGGIGDS